MYGLYENEGLGLRGSESFNCLSFLQVCQSAMGWGLTEILPWKEAGYSAAGLLRSLRSGLRSSRRVVGHAWGCRYSSGVGNTGVVDIVSRTCLRIGEFRNDFYIRTASAAYPGFGGDVKRKFLNSNYRGCLCRGYPVYVSAATFLPIVDLFQTVVELRIGRDAARNAIFNF
ncbi:hypothetical protein BV898_00880 [Hypsibius exemplaris]|uniref:Uncharacterized protein n=1 Tax=Hypsibius exemplaris TaxID=2072580 RepID=A0A1W0XD10_HYPEX|nr:hypothetical protein BV898_00880 [Hypsibius exemplaris]